jgi:hypothetical protein
MHDIHSLYRVPTLSTITKSQGQGTSRSRTSTMVRAASIVQRLDQRSISGRSLDVWVHQHFGYRMHYTWNGAFGNRCFERRLKSYRSVLDFCTTAVNGTPEGLASCMFVRDDYSSIFTETVVDLLFIKKLFCSARVFPYIPRWMDRPWYTVSTEREGRRTVATLM